MYDAVGYIGVAAAVALETIIAPIPSEVILPMAGLAASRGGFTLFEALFWTTAGSIVGAFALYGIGAWLGARRLKYIAEKMPRNNPASLTAAQYRNVTAYVLSRNGYAPGTKSLSATTLRTPLAAPPRR